MTEVEREKTSAAAYAVGLVKSGMRVGLGTGSTASIAIRMLGERVRQGLDIVGIPTSERSRALATAEGIRLTDFTAEQALDLTIDGADEADREKRLIKGGGGALLREKVVASVTRRFVVVVDSAKLVDHLGRFPLPVEVVRFAWPVVQSRLRGIDTESTLRLGEGGAPYVTDEGHFILDAHFGVIPDPERVSRYLLSTPGVVDHGLFLDMAHVLVVGRGDTVEVL